MSLALSALVGAYWLFLLIVVVARLSLEGDVYSGSYLRFSGVAKAYVAALPSWSERGATGRH